MHFRGSFGAIICRFVPKKRRSAQYDTDDSKIERSGAKISPKIGFKCADFVPKKIEI